MTKVTALCEVLAPLRPNPITVAELKAIGSGGEIAASKAGNVSLDWRQKRVLMPARPEILRGTLFDLENMAVRREITRRHARLLGGRHLDKDSVLSFRRKFTQRLGRALYEDGAAGLLYGSKLHGTCMVLFERRARLVAAGSPEPLTGSVSELEQACIELGLTLV